MPWGRKQQQGRTGSPFVPPTILQDQGPQEKDAGKPGAAPILSRDKATNLSQSLGAAEVSSAHFTSKHWYFH